MVCKEDVVIWFQRLTADKRVEVMCSLINMFLPYEVRFFGTCLEDIGKQDFHKLRDAENKANTCSSLPELQCIRDKRVQRLLVLTVSLLQSCNHASSNGIFKILEKLDSSEMNIIINSCPPDENPLEELLLLYTLALNHPAFTFEQKTVCGNILLMLQEAANNRCKLPSSKPVVMGVGVPLVYHNSSMQPCIPCQAPSEELVHNDGLPSCIPVHTVPAPELASCGPPPMLPPGMSENTSYIPLQGAYPSPSHQPMAWPPMLVQMEQPTDLQRLIAAEMPSYLPSLQQYTVMEAMGLNDDELSNLGLPSSAIAQLRSILAKYKKGNGICNLDKLELVPVGRRKPDNASTDGSNMIRGLVMGPPQCYTCIGVSRYPCVGQQMRDLRLQPASSSSSASQSPPDTPTPAPSWDKDRLNNKDALSEEERGDVKMLPWVRGHSAMMEAQPMNGLASRTSQQPPPQPPLSMQEMTFAPAPYPQHFFVHSMRHNYPYPYAPPTYVPPPFAPHPPSCYNCGAAHLATDCKELTMEEIAKPGQYHLDYTPTYQQSNDCTSDK